MSDAGNGEFANFDSRMLLYVPTWARRLAIGVLLLLVALSTALCAYAVFGTRELGSDEFLKKHVRNALQKVSMPSLGIERFKVLDGGSKDVFGHLFLMERFKVLDGGSKDVFGHLFIMEGGTLRVGGEPIRSIWLHAQTEPDLLTNPLQKLFWSQDVAMMTESFIRTALRNGLNLTTRCKPAPL